MPRKLRSRSEPSIAGQVLLEEDSPETSLLDLLDHVLTKGVIATGDVMLGVAGVDLIYVRLSALLCAADRVLPPKSRRRREERRRITSRTGR